MTDPGSIYGIPAWIPDRATLVRNDGVEGWIPDRATLVRNDGFWRNDECNRDKLTDVPLR